LRETLELVIFPGLERFGIDTAFAESANVRMLVLRRISAIE
jgi:hypothetical protein